MAGNFNHVVLAGNLTRDVEVRYAANQAAIASTAIAVNRKWDGGEETTFVDLVAYQKVAEIMQKMASKGSSVLISGRLHFNSWTAQDGTKRSRLEVVVDQFQMLEFKEKKEPQPGEQGYYDKPYAPSGNDDVPF